MESTALADAKAAANEAAQAVEALEAEEQTTGGGTGTGTTVTQYSSSVTSCVVDPETGNVSLSIELYPGDNPIVPVPVPGSGPGTTEEVPVEDLSAPEGGGVPAA